VDNSFITRGLPDLLIALGGVFVILGCLNKIWEGIAKQKRERDPLGIRRDGE
jgi:hypothetical protein